ncbi:MAG: TMEM175 family protein [Candidatus Omnitrophica bacterium]|jgi:uncharacterized membrane protein|nr:TMEM175 family protein [Candidatus Omnitrophota bacterium]
MHFKLMPQRIGALIDGIFAIVMTILVLDIKVPHETSMLTNFELEQFLSGQFQDIIVYMTVFILLGHIWVNLHNRAHYIRYTDTIHVWLNIFFLMFVALLPFSSALVNKFAGDSVASVFLAGNVFLIGVFGEWSWIYATHNRRLVDDALSDAEIAVEKRRAVVLPVVSLCAMVIAFIWPLASSYVLLIAPIIISLIRKKR